MTTSYDQLAESLNKKLTVGRAVFQNIQSSSKLP